MLLLSRQSWLILFSLGAMNTKAVLIIHVLPAFLTAILLLLRYRGSIRV